jgi:pimeloyl-ACP methyl ester carboxylesterase
LTKKYRTIAPALPGFGGAKPLRPSARGVRALARWLRTEIARASRGRRVVLVGHSMGGMIATLAAERNKDVAGIINIEGPLLPPDTETSARAARTKNFSRWFAAFQRFVAAPESGAPAHYAISIASADPAAFRSGARDIVALTRRGDMASRYARLKIPRIYFAGADGQGISTPSRRFLAQHGLRVETFAGAAHWPMTETRRAFIDRLRRSLPRLGVDAQSS